MRWWIVILLLASFYTWSNPGEARSHRHASAGRAAHGSGRSSRSTHTSRSSRSSRSVRSARGSRSSSRRGKGSTVRASAVPHEHGPTAAQIKKQETSGANDLEKRTDLERSYRAYDRGLTEWLSGNYSDAAKSLNEAYDLYSDFHGSRDVLDSLYLYDLGQAAEAAGDIELAKNSYQRSLRRRPDFSDCCIRLAGILTKKGETALALVYARRLADKNPQDPRAQFLLATMLDKAGFVEEGKTAKENFNLLMKGGVLNTPQSQVTSPETPDQPSIPGEPGNSRKPSDGNDKDDKSKKNDTDTESGADKRNDSSGSEGSAPGDSDSKKPDP